MTPDDLREEIHIELEFMEGTVNELVSLKHDLIERKPTSREKAAAAVFLADFYNGVENTLKRICRYHSISLPSGDTWHVDLFVRFCEPSYPSLPLLFDEQLRSELSYFRKFRHVVRHGYAFQLEWNRMRQGVENVEVVFSRFKQLLDEYLKTL